MYIRASLRFHICAFFCYKETRHGRVNISIGEKNVHWGKSLSNKRKISYFIDLSTKKNIQKEKGNRNFSFCLSSAVKDGLKKYLPICIYVFRRLTRTTWEVLISKYFFLYAIGSRKWATTSRSITQQPVISTRVRFVQISGKKSEEEWEDNDDNDAAVVFLRERKKRATMDEYNQIVL